jgi:hypothetical protein
MKEYIKYYYNLDIDNISNKENYYSFFYNNFLYIFVYYNRTIEELEDILKIINELKSKNIYVHEIIFNIYNSPLSKVGDLNYILLKVISNNEDYDIVKINDFNNLLVLNNEYSKLYRLNWSLLWSRKVDYIEEQVSKFGKDKKIILDSLSYYIGLCENAISYVSRVNDLYKMDNSKICLSHRRIFYPNNSFNYLNPLSFIFDLSIRDVSEYIKTIFFNNEDALLELSTYLKINKLNTYEYHMLYGRLIYPSYYFDIYESIMNEDEDESKLIPIIEKSSSYQEFLYKAYLEICKYSKIDEIEWLKKEL